MAGVGDLLGARSGDRDADGETWNEALMSKPTHLHLTRWAAALVSRALHGVDAAEGLVGRREGVGGRHEGDALVLAVEVAEAWLPALVRHRRLENVVLVVQLVNSRTQRRGRRCGREQLGDESILDGLVQASPAPDVQKIIFWGKNQGGPSALDGNQDGKLCNTRLV